MLIPLRIKNWGFLHNRWVDHYIIEVNVDKSIIKSPFLFKCQRKCENGKVSYWATRRKRNKL